MVIHLMAILGPLEGFPWSSRWLSRVWNPAQVPPQWPSMAYTGLHWPTVAYGGLQWLIVAPPPGPHLLAKTDRSSPPLYTMHYLTTF